MARILFLFLIAGLGAPDHETREACQAALSCAPEMAGPFLWQDYPDAEINRRLRDVRPPIMAKLPRHPDMYRAGSFERVPPAAPRSTPATKGNR